MAKSEDVDSYLARARKPAEDALALHPLYPGKVQILPRCPIRDLRDFAVWYTPGVAAPCRLIQAEPDRVWEHTGRGNRIAVVSDGSRVLGLGDIGPEAGLPVMEGKALLFKYLGGVDAVPLCLRSRSPEELIGAVRMLEPSFGGINLEDIRQPDCFRVLAALQDLDIPVWHDDQQGTAVVLLAGLENALAVTGREIGRIRVAMIGAGAANVAVYRLLTSCGLDPRRVVVCDRGGTLHADRADLEARRQELPEKWEICTRTNPERLRGGIAEALEGADVCIAFSSPGPGVIPPDAIRRMARDSIVFACANPVPEIWPWEAREAGARIVATGRSDFPNQLNNSLAFPAVFRGVLDVRARRVTQGMSRAAASALAAFARERGIGDDDILPRMDEWEVVPRVAAETALAAQAEGVARLARSREELIARARQIVAEARTATEILMREGVIAPIPERP
jgi:malate dehydrogenase (oxaloacetate-decarboxylating)